MGTRSLTMIRLNDDLKLANYGQYDGYPTGEGAKVAAFVQGLLDETRAELIAKRVAALRFASDAESETLESQMGADILEDLLTGIPGDLVRDDREFFENGLFCEWAYLIDLDKQKVEVYRWGKKLAARVSFAKFTPASMAALQQKLSCF